MKMKMCEIFLPEHLKHLMMLLCERKEGREQILIFSSNVGLRCLVPSSKSFILLAKTKINIRKYCQVFFGQIILLKENWRESFSTTVDMLQ